MRQWYRACLWVSHNTLFWKSHSVNDGKNDFDWVFMEIPMKNCIVGMLLTWPIAEMIVPSVHTCSLLYLSFMVCCIPTCQFRLNFPAIGLQQKYWLFIGKWGGVERDGSYIDFSMRSKAIIDQHKSLYKLSFWEIFVHLEQPYLYM